MNSGLCPPVGGDIVGRFPPVPSPITSSALLYWDGTQKNYITIGVGTGLSVSGGNLNASAAGQFLPLAGGTMTGNINMGGHQIVGFNSNLTLDGGDGSCSLNAGANVNLNGAEGVNITAQGFAGGTFTVESNTFTLDTAGNIVTNGNLNVNGAAYFGSYQQTFFDSSGNMWDGVDGNMCMIPSNRTLYDPNGFVCFDWNQRIGYDENGSQAFSWQTGSGPGPSINTPAVVFPFNDPGAYYGSFYFTNGSNHTTIGCDLGFMFVYSDQSGQVFTLDCSSANTGLQVTAIQTSGSGNVLGDLTVSGNTALNTVTSYQGVATNNNGLPALRGSTSLTNQSALKTATTLFTPAVTGLHRINCNLIVSRAATISSILGGTTGVVITYTDANTNVAQSVTMALNSQSGLPITPTSGNTGNTTTTSSNGVIVINPKSGTAVTYAIGYTSSGTTTMTYNAALTAESL